MPKANYILYHILVLFYGGNIQNLVNRASEGAAAPRERFMVML